MSPVRLLTLPLLPMLLLCSVLMASPSDAVASCAIVPAGDADCDGLPDGADLCPADTLNRCSGPVAVCATAPPGVQECTAGEDLRLDLGSSPPITDCNLDTWNAETGNGNNGSPNTAIRPTPIQNAFGCTDASTETMVGSEKFSATLTRSYPIANGEYTVNLLFAETFPGACVVGSRTMDVSLEGVQVLGGPGIGDGFDSYLTSLIQNGAGDACGGLVVRSFSTTVTDGALDLTITEDSPAAGDPNAAIKAIEILELIPGCMSDAECDDGDICTDDICNAQRECENPAGGLDIDGDTVCDPFDVCPDDGLDDEDNDGYCAGSGFASPAIGDDDNCPTISNPDQADDDADGRGNACDQCPLDSGAAEDGCLGTGFWDTRAGNQVERGEGGLATVNGRIYLIGGEQPAAGRSVEIYDIAGDFWSTGPQLPGVGPDNLGRNHIQPVVIGDEIFVVGGLTTTFRQVIGDVLVLDTSNLGAGWQSRAPMPTPRGSAACAARGVLIYCAGGVIDGPGGVDPPVDTFEIYNTVTDEWTSGPAMPRNRESAYAHVVGNDVYLITGRNTGINDTIPFTDIYDIASGIWSQGAPPPLGRGGYASGVIEGRILIISGELGVGGGGPPDGVLPNVHEYDPARNSWRAVADLPTPRHGFMGAIARDAAGKATIHTISGGPMQGFAGSTAHEVFFYGDCSVDLDCDDANACTDDVCVFGTCESTNNVAPCDDGIFCNGADSCLDGACDVHAGETCDDGIACTTDSCDAIGDTCVNAPVDLVCDDALFCNGAETCDAALGCLAGAAPSCDDGVACTIDSCDLATQACASAPDSSACSDGAFCNGAEICDALAGCVADAAFSCDDGIDCTVDLCDEGVDACTNSPDHGICNDGEFCNGNELCDAVAGCGTGAAVDCDDGVSCTVDACNEINDGCDNFASDTICDDDVFCNGFELCDTVIDCLPGVAIDCSDGVSCTVDSCNEGAEGCDNVATDAICNDGLFCNGSETCDAASDCQAGSAPDCGDGIACTVDSCDESGDDCDHAATDSLCDDIDACNGVETCDASAGCQLGTSPQCDDGNICTADSCDAAGGCINTPLAAGASCTDGGFCNGAETCDGAGSCTAGAPPQVDDAVACTIDACDEGADTVTHVATDSLCDDGAFCNGAETCDLTADCQAGAAPALDDGVSCTVDACDEAADTITHTASEALCDDTLFCNGTETCDAASDCQAGTAPALDDGVGCTVDACDEAADVVTHTTSDALCDDGIACTVDTCDAATDCARAATDTLCDDGLFCNGVETCDAGADCQAGAAPDTDDGVSCTVDACNEAGDTITHITSDALCDDGVACTIDSCDLTADCTRTATDSLCDDGLFCNGAETCDATGDCQAGAAPVIDDGVSCTVDTCDDAADTVTHTTSDSLCDDGVACTVDTCDVTGDCTRTATDSLCDDGLFCNGTETCDATGDCQAGAAPDTDDGVSCTVDSCDDAADTVTHTTSDALCDDGVACTVDTCDVTGDCTRTATDSLCDDGLFCNGAETCDVGADCQVGAAPDTDDGVSCTSDACDEATDTITHTVSHPLCNDDVGCTLDICDATTDCTHVPINQVCDDREFCNGAETCEADTGCIAGTAPEVDDGLVCTADICIEATDTIAHIPSDALCDDGIACTSDTCDAVADCTNAPTDSLCDDGLFCNGTETCDAEADCLAGAAPDTDDGVGCTVDSCNETIDAVTHTPSDTRCDDGLSCTVDTCDAAADCRSVADDTVCDDGLFCNGLEACDMAGDCMAGIAPAIDDGVSCTFDVCDDDLDIVAHLPDHAVCDDGAFCNGVESCDAAADCLPGNEIACDDGLDCTTDVCDEATDSCGAVPVDAACDDDLPCNGLETCDAVAGCQAGTAIICDDGIDCTIDSCNDATGGCTAAASAAACDDGRWCNGAESCDALAGCQAGVPIDCDDGVACTIDVCNESTDVCGSVPWKARCDDGLTCNGEETCDAQLDCLAGTPLCNDGIDCTIDSCDEATGACGVTPDDTVCDDGNHCTADACIDVAGCMNPPMAAGFDCDDGLFCNGADTCDGAGICVLGTTVDADDGLSCTADACDEDGDVVVHVPIDITCDDGVFCNGVETCELETGCTASAPVAIDDGISCTVDSCDDAIDAVTHTPDDGLCADGVFCNGTETCDAIGDCQPGGAPHLDDGIACTIDNCSDETGVVTHTPSDQACDDGLFCTGVESCDAVADCQSGSAPLIDDGVACTVDSCDDTADTIVHAADDTICDDGLFCNGDEICDSGSDCEAGTARTCDDGLDCTADSCDEAGDSCAHAADDALCDDGAYCNGLETCDGDSGCAAGADSMCDDGVDCTVDSCDEAADSCSSAADDSLCDDATFCNGAETCDASTGCLGGTAPDADDGVACTVDDCDEGADTITHTTLELLCDDGLACTADSCDATDDCVFAADDALCDDGAFCNGAETCNAGTGCLDGAAPDTDDGVACTVDDCDEATDTITHTTLDLLCDDGVACTTDSCDASDDCIFAADDSPCDDGLFCTGAETCDAATGCQSSDAPGIDDGIDCTIDSCDEDADAVVHSIDEGICDDGELCNGTETCDPDAGCTAGEAPDCDDGVDCTTDSCDADANACLSEADDATCDDGEFCNGAEICDVATGCAAGETVDIDDGIACTADACDEEVDAVTHTPDDGGCDDEQFCNGAEICDADEGCLPGDAPDIDDGIDCTTDSCDETADEVVHAGDDALCDDGTFCNGAEACATDSGCAAGTAPQIDDGIDCTVDSCDEDADTVLHEPDLLFCPDAAFCNGLERCDVSQGCVAAVALPCDDGVACTVDGCDETSLACTNSPSNAACSDGSYCSGDEICDPRAGCTAAEPVDCALADEQCGIGECSDAEQSCLVTPINEGEICSDGNACTVDEQCESGACIGISMCGVPLSRAIVPRISDSLHVLRAAVQLTTCSLCECDANGDLVITVTDALTVAKVAVGLDATLNCWLPDDGEPAVSDGSTDVFTSTTMTTMTTSTTMEGEY